MAKLQANTGFKKLKNRYRLVIMNDDTYEEVVTFKLSRITVYIVFSSVFVILTSVIVALLVFTPLRQYIPGYGTHSERRQLQTLKIKVDSLEQNMRYKDQYLEHLRMVFSGEISTADSSSSHFHPDR